MEGKAKDATGEGASTPRRRPPPSPALVLTLRVALSLLVLAVPAIFMQNSDRRREPFVAAFVTIECTAALFPLTMWAPHVGTVCLQAAYVLPAVAVGGGAATVAWYAVGGVESRVALAAAAAVLSALASAWGARTPGMSQVGGVAGALAIIVTFLGFNFERPIAPHLVLASSLAGLAAGCVVFLAASILVFPQFATDACLAQLGRGADAFGEMVGADGGGGWRFSGGESDDGGKEESGGGAAAVAGGAKEGEAPAEDAPSSVAEEAPSSVWLGASGERSEPRLPPGIKSFLERRRRKKKKEKEGSAKATTTTADEEAPPQPLPLPKPQKETRRRVPAPGYNRPPPLAGADRLSAAASKWVEMEGCLKGAEALLQSSAGEAFWGTTREENPPPLRIFTPALPPPLWPLSLRRLTRAHVVPLGEAVSELAAALRASARLCWTMRTLSSSSSLSSESPVAQVAKKVYFYRRDGGDGGGEEGESGSLLADFQGAVSSFATAAAGAVPRRYEPLDGSSSESGELSSALEGLRSAADALARARTEAATSSPSASPSEIALLLSRAAGEGPETFEEEARFGAWEGGVPHVVENAERVARAVERVRGVVPK